MKTTQFPKREPTRNLGEQETGLCQTKLLFNETMPASAYGRATYVGPPAPIVIEKLLPRSENQENVDNSTRSSISFSALSEERLLAAVRLAKRDLRRRHREELHINYLVKSHQDDSLHNTSNVDPQQAVPPINVKSKAHSSKAKGSQSGASRSLNTPQTPPTRNPGPGALAKGQEPQLSKEIRKLQNQLGVYIQKIEQLTNTGLIMEEALEPDELQRKKIRQQEQAARSARILYVLQQQVKEIQEDLDKLRSQKIGDTKKSRAMGRLAAAHRGAVRAIQVFVNQFPESSDGKVPAHYKDLGQLIRQLCLCSAKVEVDQGSAVPESALDILQKLETLDSALSKKERPQQKQARARSTSPACRKSPHRCVSHAPHAPKGPGPTTRCLGRPRKPAGLKKRAGRRMASQNPGASHRPSDRGQVLRAALQCLVQQGELREEAEPNNPSTKGGPLNPERNLMQDAGFQQPTVSSRLRVNHFPQKDYSVPWIPTSPHSPPRPQRSPQRSRPEPRCLFSPHKPSSSPTKQKVTMELGDHGLSSDKKKQAQNEALRQAWLEKTTIQRLRELNQLSKEEAERIQRLRFEVGSPTQWAERAEQKARERIQPLLDQAQQVGESRNGNGPSLRHRLSEQAAERAAESAEQLSEALLEDLLDDAARAAWSVDKDRRLESAAQCGLQAPTLESMLLRMEEMQRDQEDVRRRFVSISYADPLDWDKAQSAGPQWCAPGSRLSSPQPIKITRLVLRHTSTADIVMEKPVDMGFTSESSLTEDCQGEHQDGSRTTVPGPLERSRGTHISLPDSMLTSIQQYREDHEAYLRLVAHEAVGSFNPWAIADSLAEELMTEALAEVAAEFQDVCEEYAEAVFTSEFLQPIQSPPASVPPLGSQ